MVRILAAKPHSADVERIISYYNVLKTCKRSSLSPETIKNSLYIKMNMSVVAEFDPQPAVLKWLTVKKGIQKFIHWVDDNRNGTRVSSLKPN